MFPKVRLRSTSKFCIRLGRCKLPLSIFFLMAIYNQMGGLYMQTVVSPRPDPGKRKYPLWKVWACYITALLFTGLILATIIGAVSSLLPDSWQATVSAWSLLEYTGLAFLIIYCTTMIADIWRSRAEDLQPGFTDLPNPFYDEHFVKAPHRLQKEIRALQDELELARKEGERTAAYLRAVNQRA